MYIKTGLLCFLLLIFSATHAAEPEPIKKQKMADWVIDREIGLSETLPIDAIGGGIYYVLVDQQIRATHDDEPMYFSRYAQRIINQQGLESGSQISIQFDPIYETLVFNSVRIVRDGKIIDKLPTVTISLLQQESEMEDLIYNGQLTANIILDDVRVGDIVDYSFTRKGANPVYKNIFSYKRYVNWSVPVHQQRIRVLWGKKNPLYVNKLNTTVDITENQQGLFKEYNVKVDNAEPLLTNSETPKWYDPYGVIFFSELGSWSEVASWGTPLYANTIEASIELTRIAHDIQLKNTDKRQQIIQALEFAQNEIRYLGIETGINSHNPTPASLTLQRRYGDCKDKTVLFISLLKLLGIEANPALVHTKKTRYLADHPPTVDAFNHVLAKVKYRDEIFWLDPTRRYQGKTLSDIYQPNYHYALVLDSETKGLEKMKTNPDNTRSIIKEHFDLTKEGNSDVVFEINTQSFGYDAERLRYDIADDGLNKIQNNYLQFYRGYYTEAEPLEKLRFIQTNRGEGVHLHEKYLLKKFWESNPDKKRFEASFYGNTIIDSLSKPKQSKETPLM